MKFILNGDEVMNIAICDDNKIFREMLRDVTIEYMEEKKYEYNLDTFTSGEELISAINREYINYNLVFLDILMDKLDGIEVAKILKNINENIEIIFVTTTKEFVFNGYDIGVLNYILKPFDKEKIKIEIERYMEKSNKNSDDKFYVTKKNGIEVLSIKDIFYFDIYNRIITVHTKNRNIQFYDKFKNIEKKFEEHSFIKCHRSYLVNCRYIEKIENSDIYMMNGEKIPISRLRISNVKSKFLKYVNTL